MSDYQSVAEHLNQMRAEAEQIDSKRCRRGEPMLWFEFDCAVVPGHIYSEAGLREARMSGYCEYHFDRWFQPGWTDVITGEKGDVPDE